MDIFSILLNFWLHQSAVFNFIFDIILLTGFVIVLMLLIMTILSQHSRQHAYHESEMESNKQILSQMKFIHKDIVKSQKRYNLTEMSMSKLQQQLQLINSYINKSDKQINTTNNKSDLNYQFAIKMLKEGRPHHEISKQCSLTTGELDVLIALYKNNDNETNTTEV